MCWIKVILDHPKKKEICNETVYMEPYSFQIAPYHLKTQDMYNRTFHIKPYTLKYIQCFLRPKECAMMSCISVHYVLNWFVTQWKVKIPRDDNDYCNNYEIIEWYNSCKRTKDKKTKRKKKRRVQVHYLTLHENARMVHDKIKGKVKEMFA